MNEKRMLFPEEIAEAAVETAIKKAGLTPSVQFTLSVLAGAFIAFAAQGSTMAAFNLFSDAASYGLGKVLAGAVFGTGLMLVILAGGELFTGNTLMVTAVLSKRLRLVSVLKNWSIVYTGNFIGALMITLMILVSGQLNSGDGALGGQTLKIAVQKVNLTFAAAFFLGVMANWLVSLAIWLSYAAKDLTGKILAIFFPIWLFIISGFEHSIANMYYIPAGLLAKQTPKWAAASGLTPEALESLTWRSFLTGNLIPVTLGNLVGGALLVGGAYWWIYLKRQKQEVPMDPLSKSFRST